MYASSTLTCAARTCTRRIHSHRQHAHALCRVPPGYESLAGEGAAGGLAASLPQPASHPPTAQAVRKAHACRHPAPARDTVDTAAQDSLVGTPTCCRKRVSLPSPTTLSAHGTQRNATFGPGPPAPQERKKERHKRERTRKNTKEHATFGPGPPAPQERKKDRRPLPGVARCQARRHPVSAHRTCCLKRVPACMTSAAAVAMPPSGCDEAAASVVAAWRAMVLVSDLAQGGCGCVCMTRCVCLARGACLARRVCGKVLARGGAGVGQSWARRLDLPSAHSCTGCLARWLSPNLRDHPARPSTGAEVRVGIAEVATQQQQQQHNCRHAPEGKAARRSERRSGWRRRTHGRHAAEAQETAFQPPDRPADHRIACTSAASDCSTAHRTSALYCSSIWRLMARSAGLASGKSDMGSSSCRKGSYADRARGATPPEHSRPALA